MTQHMEMSTLPTASEWMGPEEGDRNVKVKFDVERKKIHVTDRGRLPFRMIDLRYVNKKIHFRVCEVSNIISVRVPNEIDLVSRASRCVRGEPESTQTMWIHANKQGYYFL